MTQLDKYKLPPEVEQRFDEDFTYLDEEGNRYLLGGYDKEKNINTDQIPEIKSFIAKELVIAKEEGAREAIGRVRKQVIPAGHRVMNERIDNLLNQLTNPSAKEEE